MEELIQLLLLEEYAPLSNACKSNLINIPLEKNKDKSKNEKPLPNVMLVNAISLINKTDELELLVSTVLMI